MDNILYTLSAIALLKAIFILIVDRKFLIRYMEYWLDRKWVAASLSFAVAVALYLVASA